MTKPGLQFTSPSPARTARSSPTDGRQRSRPGPGGVRTSRQRRRQREQWEAVLAAAREEIGSDTPSLRELQVFRYLSPDELGELVARAGFVELEADETFILQGDDDRHLYAIVSGSVEVSVEDSGGEQFVVGHLPAGQFVGEAAIFLREARSATVTTVEPTVLLRIDRSAMIDYLREHPAAGNKVLMSIILSLLNKLRTVNQDIIVDKQTEIDYDYVAELVEGFLAR